MQVKSQAGNTPRTSFSTGILWYLEVSRTPRFPAEGGQIYLILGLKLEYLADPADPFGPAFAALEWWKWPPESPVDDCIPQWHQWCLTPRGQAKSLGETRGPDAWNLPHYTGTASKWFDDVNATDEILSLLVSLLSSRCGAPKIWSQKYSENDEHTHTHTHGSWLTRVNIFTMKCLHQVTQPQTIAPVVSTPRIRHGAHPRDCLGYQPSSIYTEAAPRQELFVCLLIFLFHSPVWKKMVSSNGWQNQRSFERMREASPPGLGQGTHSSFTSTVSSSPTSPSTLEYKISDVTLKQGSETESCVSFYLRYWREKKEVKEGLLGLLLGSLCQ